MFSVLWPHIIASAWWVPAGGFALLAWLTLEAWGRRFEGLGGRQGWKNRRCCRRGAEAGRVCCESIKWRKFRARLLSAR